MGFPKKLEIEKAIDERRGERRRQIMTTVLRGIWLRLAIIGVELGGFALWGSFSLLLDALSSLLDIGTSFLLLLCVKLADRPPDRNHPLGHGRFEPVAGLQLGVFLIAIGGYLAVQQLFAAAGENSTKTLHPYAWIIPVFAMVLLELGYQRLKKVAQKQHSPALHADAVHYRIDGLSCLFAALALALGAYFPEKSRVLDHLGAVLIAFFMMGVGVKAFYENLHQILDRAPSLVFFQKVHAAAMRVPGVRATEKLRIQAFGPDALVSIDVEVDPQLTVEKAHEITQWVRKEIQSDWSSVRDVIVHVEPYYEGDHEPKAWH